MLVVVILTVAASAYKAFLMWSSASLGLLFIELPENQGPMASLLR